MPLWPSDLVGLLDIGLLLVLEPSLKLGQRAASMRDLVLLCLVHLGKSLAFVLEDGIPSESGRSSRKHNLALQNRQRS